MIVKIPKMTSIHINDIDIIRDMVRDRVNKLFDRPGGSISIKTIQHPKYGQYIKTGDKISLSNEITQSIVDNITPFSVQNGTVPVRSF